MVIAALSGIFGIFQTEWFVSTRPSPALSEIRQQVTIDDAVQQKIYVEYCRNHQSGTRGIIFYSPLFNEKQVKLLETAKDALMRDLALQSQLRNDFGHSFDEVNAFFVPAWELHNPWNQDVVGLTKVGWFGIKAHAGDPNILGFTMRDRQNIPMQLTIDGTPRVALNLEAFVSAHTLQLTVYHELLHAANVPAYDPPRVTLLQTDLTYLPQYRDYIHQTGLDDGREQRIWLVIVFAPWTVCLLVLVQTVYYRKRRLRV